MRGNPVIYSQSGRYGCRQAWNSGAQSDHKILINDFETGKMHVVHLISKFHSLIVHFYWIDDEQLGVVYKKYCQQLYRIVNGEKEIVEYEAFNRECRMLYKIDLTAKEKKFYPVSRKYMKAFLVNSPDPIFTEQSLTIDGKEYYVIFYESPINKEVSEWDMDEPWENVPVNEDPNAGEPRLATAEEIHTKEIKDKEAELRYAEKTQLAKVHAEKSKSKKIERKLCWLRFIAKNFEDDDLLPDIKFDMKEIFEAVGFKVERDDDKKGSSYSLYQKAMVYGPHFYTSNWVDRILKMNLQTFFNTFLTTGIRPKYQDFCEELVLPIPKMPGYAILGINNGYLYVTGNKARKNPRWTMDNFNKIKNNITEAILRVVWKRRFIMHAPSTDFTKIGDIFINIVDLRTSKWVGMFNLKNKQDACDPNFASVHPSGQIFAVKRDVYEVRLCGFLRCVTSRQHYYKQNRLALVKSEASHKEPHPFKVFDNSKLPKFVRKGKKNLSMTLSKQEV